MKTHARILPVLALLLIASVRPVLAAPVNVLPSEGWSDGISDFFGVPDDTSTPITITGQPNSLSVATGATATFSVTATGTGTLKYQWFVNGRPIEGATSATYSVAAAALSDAGTYMVVVGSDRSSAVSNAATLSVTNAGVVSTGPASQTIAAGSDATFSVAASESGLTYQWSFNRDPISGATGPTYTVSNAGATAAGTYSVSVSDASGLVASESATLTVTMDARLTNLSIRGQVEGGDRILDIGLSIHGTGNKQVLLRAVGPTLATFGVTGFLSTPELTLYGDGHQTIATNMAWGGSTALSAAFTQVGAFDLPSASADSAMLQSLGAGTYSATVTGENGSTGIALAEIYDADTGTPTSDLVNLSARAYVANGGGILIAGFVITGTSSETVLIRGVGPTLGGMFGIGDALADTKVTLFDSTGAQVAANEGWGDDPDIDSADDRVGAFHFMKHSKDSALLVTLAPGTYTAQVSGGFSGSNGIGLVEIYRVN